MSAKDRQVGGSHYTDRKIQAIEYILTNNLDFCEGNVIKYLARWKNKGGVEDLRKAIHYIEMLIDHEENNNNDGQPHKASSTGNQRDDYSRSEGQV